MTARPLRVLLLAWAERRNASARARIFELAGWLAGHGVEAQVLAPVGGGIGDWLARPGPARRGRRAVYLAAALARRAAGLGAARGAGAVVLQRELFPFGPPWLERRLLAAGPPVVYDVDDALHLQPPHFRVASHGLHRFAKAEEIARRARAVVVASTALEAWARPLAARVERIATPVDVGRFRPLAEPPANSLPVVGWTGTAGNLAHLEAIRPALAAAAREAPFALRVVSEAPPRAWPGPPPVEFVPWSLEGEAAEVARFDVGLMPLVDSEYARAKAGYKALVAMACGVPVVVSPVGANREIVEPGVEGLHASALEEWQAQLLALLRDPSRRRAMGANGRRKVERSFSHDALFPRWLALLEEVAR